MKKRVRLQQRQARRHNTVRGKTRITIRIDDDILEWFRVQVHKVGGGNCQTLMNEALRRFIDSDEGDMEDLLRRVIREELAPYTPKKRKK